MKYTNLKEASRQDKTRFYIGIALSCAVGFVLSFKVITMLLPVQQPIKTVRLEVVKSISEPTAQLKSFEQYKKDLAFRESTNTWDTLNQYGYIGLYQFGALALKDVGLNIDSIDFKNNPYIFPPSKQDKALERLIRNNKRYLRNYYNYVGTKVNGILVTESGMLTAAHLVGHGPVKKFLKSGVVTSDGNGTKLTEYMKLFSGYEI